MNRRDFMGSASLGMAGAYPLTPAHAAGKDDEPHTGLLRIKGAYYRHYPVDFNRGSEGALGFRGWGEMIETEVTASETALISMHVWNIGLSPHLPFSPDGPGGGTMTMLEWVPRSASIIKREFPPLFSATRAAGIPIIHVASGNYAKKYPGYESALSLAGPEPEGPRRAILSDRQVPPDDIKDTLLFGPLFKGSRDHVERYLDFPEEASPRDDEYVVLTAHELTEVLRDKGIWNLIYVGFAINWCLWFSPCGMLDMSRLGYRCNCIQDCVTAVENRESTIGEFNKAQAMWRTSLMFGYIYDLVEYTKALERLRAQ